MKILICGLGSIGQRHARNLISLGYSEIFALRTRSLPLPDDLRTIETVKDINEAKEVKPGVVFITNPTSLHIPRALEFAKVGSHLFIEKPLSNTLEGVNELKKIVAKNKLVAMVGYNFRFHPQLIQIKKILEEKKIGKIIAVSTVMGEYLPNWHPEEDYRQGYSARSDLGGGVILTQSHDLDYLYWLIGDYAEVYAQASKISDLEIDVEDTAQVLIKFKSGVLGSLLLDYLQNPPKREMIVIGTSGKILWDYYGNYFEVAKEGKTKMFQGRKDFERNEMYVEEIRHFLSCVKERKNPSISLEEGEKIVKACLAAKKSAKEKRPIKLD